MIEDLYGNPIVNNGKPRAYRRYSDIDDLINTDPVIGAAKIKVGDVVPMPAISPEEFCEKVLGLQIKHTDFKMPADMTPEEMAKDLNDYAAPKPYDKFMDQVKFDFEEATQHQLAMDILDAEPSELPETDKFAVIVTLAPFLIDYSAPLNLNDVSGTLKIKTKPCTVKWDSEGSRWSISCRLADCPAGTMVAAHIYDSDMCVLAFPSMAKRLEPTPSLKDIQGGSVEDIRDDRITPPVWAGPPLGDPMKMGRNQSDLHGIRDTDIVEAMDELEKMDEEPAREGGVYWDEESQTLATRSPSITPPLEGWALKRLDEEVDKAIASGSSKFSTDFLDRAKVVEQMILAPDPLQGVSNDLDHIEAVIRNYLLPAIKGLPALKVNVEAFRELKERFDPVDLCSLLDTKVLVIQELMSQEEQGKLFDDAEVD